MITPVPKLVEPVVCLENADAFDPDRLEISEEEDLIGPLYSADPFVLIGADGAAWRVHEFWGPPIPPQTIFSKVVTWIVGGDNSPSLVGREVTPVTMTLDAFKNEVCRRITAYPNAIFNDELLAGEDLPRGGDLEALTAALVKRVCADVRAATSIADAMDAMLFAGRDQYEWAEEFHRRPTL